MDGLANLRLGWVCLGLELQVDMNTFLTLIRPLMLIRHCVIAVNEAFQPRVSPRGDISTSHRSGLHISASITAVSLGISMSCWRRG